MGTKKRNIALILLIAAAVSIITVSVVAFNNEYYKRTHDPAKGRIFEIEGTGSFGFDNRCYKYFMVQDCPGNDVELRKLIHDFLEENKIFEKIMAENAKEIYFYFMIPSWIFPVYWPAPDGDNRWDDNDPEYYCGTNEIACFFYDWDDDFSFYEFYKIGGTKYEDYKLGGLH